jgi:hypothetical protein
MAKGPFASSVAAQQQHQQRAFPLCSPAVARALSFCGPAARAEGPTGGEYGPWPSRAWRVPLPGRNLGLGQIFTNPPRPKLGPVIPECWSSSDGCPLVTLGQNEQLLTGSQTLALFALLSSRTQPLEMAPSPALVRRKRRRRSGRLPISLLPFYFSSRSLFL